MKRFLRELIYGKRNDLISRLASIPLFFFSLVYRFIHFIRRSLYSHHVFKVKKLSSRVISVGNITLGGVGKSPFVAFLAQELKKKGYKTGILSRGYKRKRKNRIDIVSDRENLLLDPYHAGDEPYMLARGLQGIPVVVGKERYNAGRMMIERFDIDILILDDGFQHLSLARDINILLIDTEQPFSNYRLFPMGILREPLKEMKRADIIVFTKCNSSKRPDIGFVKRYLNRDISIYYSSFEPSELIDLNEGTKKEVSCLKDKRVLAFCGIAEPESFRSLLGFLQADIKKFLIFPDHHNFSKRDMDHLYDIFNSESIDLAITTEKDSVRLLEYLPARFPLWQLNIKIKLEEEKGLERLLSQVLGQ